MARKLQIRRGAKADLPTLSQGEFGFCTDAGAEELHLGTGSKNLGLLKIDVYYGDPSDLVTSGIYRLGTHENLPEALWYGQLLVMQGLDSDTVCQIGMGYTSSALYCRAGQRLSSGVYRWSTWATPPDASGMVAKSGDTMTGVLNISNPNDYIGLQKYRSINDSLFNFVFGIGNDTARGASGSLRLTNSSGVVKGRIDAWENGELTYKNDETGYLPIGRVESGSYTGTGTYKAANPCSLTFDFVPKFLMVQREGAFTGSAYSNFIVMGQPTLAYIANSGSTSITISWDNNGKTISWYQTYAAENQLNASGTKYTYIAIG